jgi:Polysaccharide lyase
VRNQWLDFKFQIRFSQQDSGAVTAYLNQKSIINYKGVTSYSGKKGYHASHNTYYFKMGLYRDRMQDPMTIYIDDYQKKEVDGLK